MRCRCSRRIGKRVHRNDEDTLTTDVARMVSETGRSTTDMYAEPHRSRSGEQCRPAGNQIGSITSGSQLTGRPRPPLTQLSLEARPFASNPLHPVRGRAFANSRCQALVRIDARPFRQIGTFEASKPEYVDFQDPSNMKAPVRTDPVLPTSRPSKRLRGQRGWLRRMQWESSRRSFWNAHLISIPVGSIRVPRPA